MDNWGNESQTKSKDYSRMILLAIIAVLLVVIVIIAILIVNIQSNTFRILVDGNTVSESKNLLKTVDNNTYISIQDLATILGYEYHVGEYKVFSADTDKCYIQSKNETASFYLNSNKINKLKVNNLTEDYETFTADNRIVQIDNKFYAPLDAIQTGFNVKIQLTQKALSITTLETILKNIDNSLSNNKETSNYKSLLEESFENQKAVLYDYIILSKKDTGLYGVVTTSGKEILPDKYTSITFLETTKEFVVTNSLGKMGIIDQNGKNKIEQLYDSIKVIHNNPKLYLVSLTQKYGVIDENGATIIYPEYDTIGADNFKYKNLQNQYILLDSVIPVSKNKKYGLFDITGKKVLDTVYDGIGYELETAELNGTTKAVNSIIAIEECKGIIVKSGKLYGLYSIEGKEMVPARVNSIYSITSNGIDTYYMIYNNEEINLIERLIKAGVIADPNQNNNMKNTINNTIENNINNAVGINSISQMTNTSTTINQ